MTMNPTLLLAALREQKEMKMKSIPVLQRRIIIKSLLIISDSSMNKKGG